MAERLESEGWALVATGVSQEILQTLRDTIFEDGEAGSRCRLDESTVRGVSLELKEELVRMGVLRSSAVAIQAIAFDKTPGTNWKVAWHQDLMFPFANPVRSKGYDVPSKKNGIDYARPPLPVLEQLLAVRLHLDDCREANGPLRICPGSHREGLVPSQNCRARVAERGELVCLAKEGEALLMKPLLLHASSQATAPAHRRVLHLVYHSGEPIEERWHRQV